MTAATSFNTAKKYLLTALLPSLALFVTITFTTAPVWADAVIATIPAGNFPSTIALNPVTNRIYVTNEGTANITVIDGATNTTTTVAVGGNPQGIAVNPSTNKIYVTSNWSHTVTVIDGVTNSTTTVAVGFDPRAIAVNTATNKVYVANYGSNTVTVIDGYTNTTTTVSVGSGPRAIAVNPDTNKIYVANSGVTAYGSDTVTVIDGATNITSTVTVGYNPVALAINLVTNKIYVANHYGAVTVIDGITNTTTTVAAGTGPIALAINPVTNTIYVANYEGSNVTVIDGATNSTTTVASGSWPRAVAVNQATNSIYVANRESANVTVIDGTTNSTRTVAVGSWPQAIGVNSDTNRIYVANIWSNTVSVIDGAATATSLISSQNPSIIGSSVTFTATVTAGSSTGVVAFRDGGATIAGCAAQVLTAGAAICTTSALSHGTHLITANYSGDGYYAASNSAEFQQFVAAPTTTSLSSSSNPSNFGSSVTFTAIVSGVSPTGTVAFQDGFNAIVGCTAQALVAGAASCTTSTLTAGTHTITATYSGNSTNTASTSPGFAQFVNPVPTATNLSSSINPSILGSGVTFTASVSGTSPSGTVAFQDGGVAIAGCAAQALVAGAATCSTSALNLGTHTITAVYSGDYNYLASTSSVLSQTIKTASTTSLISSKNPSTFGRSVTFTATVSGTAPTGTVAFRDGGVAIAGCAAQVLATRRGITTATCTTSALTIGTHPLSAVYSGDSYYAASTSAILTQTVK